MFHTNTLKTYYAIGLMSGTSLDGLDIAYVKLDLLDGNWAFSLLRFKSVTYSKQMKNKLASL